MTTLFERAWHSLVPLDNPAGAIYGTIITAGLIAGQADEPIREITLSVAVTLVVYWLAHVYADVLAHDVDGRRPLSTRRVLHAMGSEWPIVEAAFAPLAVLLIAYAFGVKTNRAVSLALWFTVVLLVGWGLLAGRRNGLTGIRLLAAGGLAGLFGIVISLLEAVLH